MKVLFIAIVCALFAGGEAFAQQARFTSSGTIQYEKTVNMFAVIKNQMDIDDGFFGAQLFDQYKKDNPQFKKLQSTLTFGDNKTIYKPIVPENVPTRMDFFSDNPSATQSNLVYTDFSKSATTIQKTVFEETFLVKDSLRKITWKITDETREIAGYKCRRANGLLMDSIYAVAFYTDKIPVSGGPESFSGLPGMILGVALPHENLTWFATKVTDENITAIEPPKKGKPVNNKQLYDTLKKVMKNWGKQGMYYLKMFLL